MCCGRTDGWKDNVETVPPPPKKKKKTEFEEGGIKIAEFANSIDLDKLAHNKPPHLDLHSLHSSL